ncbi:MAG: MobA/MobL family protein [Rhodospirillales bacterium]
MAISYLLLAPVKKAGTTIARSAHHGGHRLTRGALGKAAYLAGERLHGHDGQVVDYRAKADGVEHSQLVLPGGGAADRERLWQAIDAYPTQKPTATIARDMIVAFPHELTFAERKAAAVALAGWIADRYGVAVDLGMHRPDLEAGSNERNWHGHYLISERRVSPAGEIGRVNRELNQMVCRRRDPERGRDELRPTAAAEIRAAWQRIANDALERGGHQERIDCRSYKAQGVDRQAGKHRGAAETKRQRDRQRGRGAAVAAKEQGRAATKERPGRSPESASRISATTVMAVRAELVAAAREMTARSRVAAERIAAIQAQRQQSGSAPGIAADIGSVQGWLHDPARQFVRAWEAADRASALRRRIREARRGRGPLREPTVEEAAELRRAGRERSRAEALGERIEQLIGQLARFDPADRIGLPPADTAISGKRLDAIERELARLPVRSRDHGEMELA